MQKQYYVYIMGSVNLTLYIGVTNNLIRRVYEHKERLADSFTKKYNINRLLYYEIICDPQIAITREKRMKKWNRNWKLELIKKNNPELRDLYYQIIQ